jgi:hypothetical protein
MKTIIALILGLLLAGCASFDGYTLKPGTSTVDETMQLMGEPAMRWQETDGTGFLVYPRGPAGVTTYMFRFDARGILASRENVLDMKHFALIRSGMGKEDVLRIIGPPFPGWTQYFAARDELVWEWRWCDDYSEPARFDVLFDGTSGLVRSTQSMAERQSMPFGRGDRRDWCSR